jgi:hypothetical protein
MEMELQGTASNEAGILQGEPGTIISLKEKDNHLGQIRAENLTCQATHETDMSSCQVQRGQVQGHNGPCAANPRTTRTNDYKCGHTLRSKPESQDHPSDVKVYGRFRNL